MYASRKQYSNRASAPISQSSSPTPGQSSPISKLATTRIGITQILLITSYTGYNDDIVTVNIINIIVI